MTSLLYKHPAASLSLSTTLDLSLYLSLKLYVCMYICFVLVFGKAGIVCIDSCRNYSAHRSKEFPAKLRDGEDGQLCFGKICRNLQQSSSPHSYFFSTITLVIYPKFSSRLILQRRILKIPFKDLVVRTFVLLFER